MGCMHFSDAVFTLTGDSLCIWDPQGRSLSKPSAAGHEYKCTGGNAQLVDQFPDQFACWDFGGMDVRKTMHSTLIRLPLRTEAMAQNSSLSKAVWPVKRAEEAVQEFAAGASRAMLFMRHLSAVALWHWPEDSTSPAPLHHVELREGWPWDRSTAQRLPFNEDQWRRKLLKSIIGHLSKAQNVRRVIKLTEHAMDGKESFQRLWLISAVALMGNAHRIATDPNNARLALSPTVAVAVCLQQGRKLEVVPQGGLLGPLPLSFGLPDGPAQPSRLSKLPFVAYATFAMDSSGWPWREMSAESALLAAIDFNAELLSGLALAWGEACDYLQELPRQSTPARWLSPEQLYAIIPGAETMAAEDPEAQNDARLSTYIAKEVCHAAASKAMWQLRGGRLVQLRYGCFLQDASSQLGAAALDLIQSTVPVFSAPWHVKEALEAAGVPQLTSTTPSRVRDLLKRGFRRNALELHVIEAAQLFLYCILDVEAVFSAYACFEEYTTGSAEASAAHESLSALVHKFPNEVKELGQKLLAAVNPDQNASASGTPAGEPSESTALPFAAPAHTTDSTGDDSVKAELISTADRLLRELAGVPIPNAPGQIVALGSVRLYVAPADAPMGQLDILPNTPKLWQSLAHELVRLVLAQMLRVLPVCGPAISGALQIHRLSLSVLNGHLEHVLGKKWSQGTSAVKPHINQWPMALEPTWNLLLAVHNGEASEWDGLGRWYLLPCSSGQRKAMVRMSHRGLVFWPRYESCQESPAESTASPRSFPVAVEDSLSTQRSSSVLPELSLGEGGSALGGEAEVDADSAPASTAAPDLASVQAAQLAERSSTPQPGSATGGTEPAGQQPQQESSLPGANDEARPETGQSAGAQPESGHIVPEIASSRSLTVSEMEASSLTVQSLGSTERRAPGQRNLGSTLGTDDSSSTQSASTTQVQRAQSGQVPAADSGSTAATKALTRERLAQPWAGLLLFLQELGLPILDRSYDHLAHVCALQHPTEQDTIVHKLLQCRNAGLLDAQSLSAGQRSFLFDYLCEHVPQTDEEEARTFVRRLPILPTFIEARRRPAQDALLCSQQLLSTFVGDISLLPEALLASIARYEEEQAGLFAWLQVAPLTEAQLLQRVLLPNFNAVPQKTVLDRVLQAAAWRTDAELTTTLTAISFVQTGSAEDASCRANELFDPTVPLFKDIFKHRPELFPAQDFTTPEWLELLRVLGLEKDLSQVAFRACAEEVEAWDLANMEPEQKAEALTAARQLVQELATSPSLQGTSLYHAIRDIGFVPASLGVPGSREATSKLATFSEAILPKDWPLAFLAAPVLEEACVPPPFAWNALKLRSPPVLTTVLRHAQHLSRDAGQSVLASWPAQALPPEVACGKVLEYLNAQGLNAAQQRELQSIALVPVANNTRLLPPERLFLRLRDNLTPFAYELPAAFTAHTAVLQELGMKQEPTASDLVKLVVGMKETIGMGPFNVNELLAMLRLLRYVCSHKDAELMRLVKRAHARGQILVPNSDCCLVATSACVRTHSCPPQLLARASASVVCVHPQLPEDVCRLLGIPPLQEVVAEMADGKQPLVHLDALDGLECKAMQALLKHPAFVEALHTLLKPYSMAVPALVMPVQELARKLSAAAGQLCFVQRCYTRLSFSDSRAVRAQSQSLAQVYEFQDAQSGRLCVAQPPKGVSAASLVASALSWSLGSSLRLPLEPLLACSPESLPRLQQTLFGASTGQDGYNLMDLERAGQLGSPLLPTDMELLQVKPLRPFAAGEICAFKEALTPAQAAAAAAHRRAGTTDDDGISGLCYGRVARDARPEPGTGIFRVSVEVSESQFRDMLSTDIFSFRSACSARLAAQGAAIGTLPLGADSAELEAAQEPDSALPSPPAAPLVSPTEMAGAVTDLLKAAGMPLDLERQQLLQQSLTMQQQVTDTQEELARQAQALEELQREGEAVKESYRCRICLSNDVDAVMTQCGHALCWTCASGCNDRCPFCRTPSFSIRMYR